MSFIMSTPTFLKILYSFYLKYLQKVVLSIATIKIASHIKLTVRQKSAPSYTVECSLFLETAANFSQMLDLTKSGVRSHISILEHPNLLSKTPFRWATTT